jgi:hypothetical protein
MHRLFGTPHGLPAACTSGPDPDNKPRKNRQPRRRLVSLVPLALAILTLSLSQPARAASGTWSTDGYLNSQRQNHTATLLGDGQVLVTGGSWHGVLFFQSAEIYNPATGKWTFTDSLSITRQNHTATRLTDGRVLVAGGANYSGAVQASCEIYNPADGTWAATGSLSQARSGHRAVPLIDGRVLVVGGTGDSGLPLGSAEIYDPAKESWSGAGTLATGRTMFTATRLADGRVLVAGGWGTLGALATCEIYDPATGGWAPTDPLTTERYAHTASLLSDGRVLVAGGDDNTGWSPMASAELFNPASHSWSLAAGAMQTARYYHTAATLADGRVLVIEGVGADGTTLTDAELYQPASQTWSDAGSLSTYRDGFTATRLLNGWVLVAGGYNENPYPSECEIYIPPKPALNLGSLALLLLE